MQSDAAKNGFTTQEFANLCEVNKHTLFHYDAMGIFSPAVRGENGYRYYSVAQLEVFHVIATLKALDMPLAQIKAYMDRRSPEELVRLLEAQDLALERKLHELRRMRELIREKAALTQQAMQAVPAGLHLRQEPPRLLVRTPAGFFSSDRDTAESVAAHVRYCRAHDIHSAHSIGSMIPRTQAAAKNLDGYSYVYTRVSARPKGVAVFERPAGSYLTLFHAEGYDNSFACYTKLLTYAQEEGLQLAEDFYEDVLLDELSVNGYDRYLLQISIQIIGGSR